MSGPRVALTPRDLAGRTQATCSDVGLNVDIVYATDRPAPGTDVQRRIEALVQLPTSAWLVSIGGLELMFGDGVRLSSLGLYANFANAEAEDLLPLSDAPAVWLALPEFDPAEDDRFSVDTVVRVSVDRPLGAVRLRLTDTSHEHRAYSLTDGLIAWVDAAGCLTGLVVHGIQWTVSAPVGPTRRY